MRLLFHLEIHQIILKSILNYVPERIIFKIVFLLKLISILKKFINVWKMSFIFWKIKHPPHHVLNKIIILIVIWSGTLVIFLTVWAIAYNTITVWSFSIFSLIFVGIFILILHKSFFLIAIPFLMVHLFVLYIFIHLR